MVDQTTPSEEHSIEPGDFETGVSGPFETVRITTRPSDLPGSYGVYAARSDTLTADQADTGAADAVEMQGCGVDLAPKGTATCHLSGRIWIEATRHGDEHVLRFWSRLPTRLLDRLGTQVAPRIDNGTDPVRNEGAPAFVGVSCDACGMHGSVPLTVSTLQGSGRRPCIEQG